MLTLDLKSKQLRYPFLKCVKNTFQKYEKTDVFNNIVKNPTSDHSGWFAPFKCHILEKANETWLEELGSKSSLFYYAKLKNEPSLENYLLEKINFNGANLKFKVRSNTLPLDSRLSKWTDEINGCCTICNSGDTEDIIHFLFTCTALTTIRENQLDILRNELLYNDEYNVWESYNNGNLEDKLVYVLGGNSIFLSHNALLSFDSFCKSYLIKSWQKRTEMKALQDQS